MGEADRAVRRSMDPEASDGVLPRPRAHRDATGMATVRIGAAALAGYRETLDRLVARHVARWVGAGEVRGVDEVGQLCFAVADCLSLPKTLSGAEGLERRGVAWVPSGAC